MYEIKSLREELGQIKAEQKELAAKVEQEARVFSDEELASYDSLEAQAAEKEAQIATAERIEKTRQFSAPVSVPVYHAPRPKQITQADYDAAFKGWALYHATGKVKSFHEAAADKIGFDLKDRQMRVSLYDALTEGVDAAVTIQEQPHRGVIKTLVNYSPMRQCATVIRTANGNPLPWLTENDTANSAVARANLESVTATEYALGEWTLNSYGYDTSVGPVAVETLEDASVNLRELIMNAILKRMGRKSNAWHTTGTGSEEPEGIAVAVTPSLLWPSTTQDWYDVLVAMVNGVDPDYANPSDPGVGFVFGSGFKEVLQTLRNENGDPLWIKSLTDGNPQSILGYRYWINSAMPAYSTDSATSKVLFGQISDFIIRDVDDLVLDVDDTTYRKYRGVAFHAFHRTDSGYSDTGSIVGARMVSGSEAANCGVVVSA